MLVFAMLAPALTAQLDRPFSNILIMTDASPTFGFGVSTRECELELIESLSAKAERFGDHIRLELGAEDEPEKEQPKN